MANDLSNPVQANPVSGDGFFEHGAGQDSLFSTVQLAQNGTAAPTATGQTIHVTPPQGAAGPVVIRVEVTPGSTVELPQPFEADAALMAKEGDGNLAIRVGDVTVVLQGYIEANGEAPVIIEGADNQPIDIATILASTDPAIDIQTAAGPDAGQSGQGADNSGAILAQLEGGDGLGGFEGAGAQDGTELGYRTIDASIRNDFADPLAASANVFGFSVNGFSGAFQEGFLRDPAQTSPFGNSQGTVFDTFLHEYRDAVENPGQAMFAGWADFHGTAVTQNNDFDQYLTETSKTTTVTVNFTNGTGDLVLTGIGDGVTSNGSDLSVEIRDDGHTMFVRRDEATATDTGNALVAVIHVDGPDANGQFTIETILINRIDHHEAGNDTMDMDIQFTVYDGPAPQQQEGESGDIPQGPTSPALEGHLTASFEDDVPILEKVTYNNQHDGSVAAREGVEAGGSDIGRIDEDWLHGGAKDTGADGKSNAGDNGDTGGGTCVTGAIKVNFGADGGANWDGATEKATQAEKHAFTLDTALYLLGKAFPYGTDGLTSGGKPLVVLSVDGDHVTVGIADEKQNQKLAEGEEGDTSGDEPTGPTDPIPGCTIFTLTLDQTTGTFKFELKGPLDHGDSIFGDDDGVSALVADQPENTIPLQFGVTAMDDDGDKIHVDINIDVNDDMPVARNDQDTVAAGSHDAITGNVMTGADTDSPSAGKDSQGADHAHVVGIVAGDTTGVVGKEIHGQYGKLTLNADGSYTYVRDAYSKGGVDDVFTYTLKDGDGDTSTATLTVHIQDATVSIDLPSAEADTTVYESGLPVRSGEAAGSAAAADSEHTEGTITITAKDGIKSLEIGGDTLTLQDLKDLGTTHHPIADATGTLTLTGFDEATGKLTYTYDLADNTDANSKSSVTFDIKVTDVDGDTGTAALKINIVDDEPTAVCDELKVVAPKEPTADVQFVLDISGSMKDQYANVPGNSYPDNRIGLERYAVEQMLTAHPEIQNVQIVLFDDHASHSAWMTRDQALTWIQNGSNFNGQGGSTNFDAALSEAMEGFVETRPLTHGDQTLVYFFSDGNPNEPRDEGITDVGANDPNNVSVKEWTDFVNAHGISNVFGVGIPGIASHLAPIAYPDGSGNSEPNQIGLAGGSNSQLDGLLDTLTDTIVAVVTPVHGNLTTNDTPGADSFGDGKLVSVSYDGNTVTFTDNTTLRHIDLGAGRGSIDIKGDGSFDYTPPAKNADGTPFYLEYTIQDGDGDTSTAKLKIDINTRPQTDLNGAACGGADNQAAFVEDHGAIQIAPDATISEDGPLIASMTVTLTNRPDGNAESLGLNADALNLVAQTGGTVTWSYNAATGVLTITGNSKPSWYESFLQGVVYNNTSDTPNTAERHVTVVVKDFDPDTNVSQSSTVHTVDISVSPWNDAPDATINPVSFAANEDQSINLSGKLGNTLNMMISDPDSGNDDVTVTISVTEGKLTVEDGWTGVTITNNNSMSVTLKGSVAEINNLLKESNGGYVKYVDENNTPTHDVTLTLKVNDNGENGGGGAKFDQATATIYVTAVNDKPVTDLNGNSNGQDNSASFVEDSPAVKIAPNGKISDVDSSNLTSMTVTITNVKDGSAESLSVNPALLPGGVTANYANGVLTISGPASVAAYQTILQNIVYNNSSDTPNTTSRSVTVVVNDGSLNSDSHTSTISVTPHNDAPTAQIFPPSYAAAEDQSINLTGKIGAQVNMLIGDPDSASDDVYVTLSVTQGKLDVNVGSTGVSIISGDNSASVGIRGSVTEINNLLKESGSGYVKYVNDSNNPAAHVTLTLAVNDDGQNGTGGDQTASATTTIDITPVNDKPVTDLNGGSSGQDSSASFVEDGPAVKIAPNGTISDVDSSNLASMTVTITNVKDGSAESLAINPALLPGGVTANYANGVLTISGPASVATYQTILQNIVYNNSSDTPNTTSRSVTVVVNDGSLNSDSHTSTISVTPHNDAPTATALQSGLNVNEGASLNIAGKGLAIADVDAGSDTITVKLTVGEGALTVTKGGAGVSISGSGSDTVYISGSQSEINKVLTGTTGSMTYKDDTDAPAASTKLTMTVDDNGNNGIGGDQTVTVETTIAINPQNDAPTACDDNVYTNAGATQISIGEWMLVRNDSDPDTDSSKFDLISGNAAVANVSGSTVSHDNGSGTDGVVKFTDTNGNFDSKFDYTFSDGSGGTAIGHVTVHQDTSGTLTASSGDDIVIVHPTTATTVDAGAGDDIVVGGSKNDRLDGGADDDLIFGGGGNDTMIFGNGDKYDGGADFDRIEVTGSNGGVSVSYNANTFLNVEMIDLGEDTNRQGQSHQNTLALNAGDVGVHDYGTVGNFKISLFVIGDTNGDSGNSQTQANNRDNVGLHDFTKETGAGSTGSFTDAATGDSHTFNVWTSNINPQVHVAVEQGLDIV
jgi:hypothetical protein